MPTLCNQCMRRVHSHSPFLKCSVCCSFTHLACLPNVNKSDSLYTNRLANNWFCIECSHCLPFNHYVDNTDFIKAIGINSASEYLSLDNVSSLLSPSDLDIEDINNPLSSADPDLNFFNGDTTGNCLHPCNYYCEDEFIKACNKYNVQSTNFSLMHANIRSVSKNYTEMESYVQSLEHQFNIIALSETWFNETNVTLFNPYGYKVESKHRTGRSGGGVSLLISESMNYNVRNDLSIYNDCIESLFIEIPPCSTIQKEVVVGVIYRPPNTNVNDFTTHITDLLSTVKKESKLCYLLGDFNINLLNSDTHILTSEFLEVLYSYSFTPLITKPTRVTSQSATLIDNIFCNHQLEISGLSGICLTDISDHFPIFFIDLSTISKVTTHTKITRQITQTTMNKFCTSLQNQNWDTVQQNHNAQEAYSIFHKLLTTLYNTSFPCKPIKSEYRNRKGWLTQGLKKSIKLKNKLYVLSLKYPTLHNQNTYKQYRNKLRSILQKCERKYYDTIFAQNKNNLKKSWSLIKEVINKKQKAGISNKFCIEGHMTSDPSKIANAFNKFYINIGPSLAKNIPNTNIHTNTFLSHPNSSSMFLTNTDCYEIETIIKNFKMASPGWDDISSKVVKSSYQHFLEPLAHLLNLSISQGIVPRELKLARVIPIYKKGDKTDITNYRPVSILPCISKILERLIYNRLSNFINKHNILYDLQFGFREKHGTNLALSFLIDNIVSAHEKGNSVLGVFIDFSKAFDTINHNILFEKLYHYGIRGLALDWFRSYLSDRAQYVQFNDAHSDYNNIICGVPQGSILGPLLFLLYINDIVNVSEKLLPILFADDTNMFITGNNIDVMIQTMNEVLEKLMLWLNTNKLSLNVKKTHYVIFTPGRSSVTPKETLKINNITIDREETTTFLGVKLDSKLSWIHHIQGIKTKIAKNIGILCKARKVFQMSTLLTLYYCFIYPYVSYCIEVWGTAAKKYSDSLLKLQKLCCRIITGSPKRTSSELLFNTLNVLPISKIYEYNVMILMFRFYNGNLPKVFDNIFKKKMEPLGVETRQRNHLRINMCKSKKALNTIRYKGAMLWNNMFSHFNLPCSIHIFKKTLKVLLYNG